MRRHDSHEVMSALPWRHVGGRTARRGGGSVPAMWPSHVSRNPDEAACARSSHGEEGSMNSATHIHLKRNPTPLVRSSNRRQIEVTNTQENNKATVREFYDLAFNQRKPAEAVAKHVGN